MSTQPLDVEVVGSQPCIVGPEAFKDKFERTLAEMGMSKRAASHAFCGCWKGAECRHGHTWKKQTIHCGLRFSYCCHLRHTKKYVERYAGLFRKAGEFGYSVYYVEASCSLHQGVPDKATVRIHNAEITEAAENSPELQGVIYQTNPRATRLVTKMLVISSNTNAEQLIRGIFLEHARHVDVKRIRDIETFNKKLNKVFSMELPENSPELCAVYEHAFAGTQIVHVITGSDDNFWNGELFTEDGEEATGNNSANHCPDCRESPVRETGWLGSLQSLTSLRPQDWIALSPPG
jgi:hypothetical protein